MLPCQADVNGHLRRAVVPENKKCKRIIHGKIEALKQ